MAAFLEAQAKSQKAQQKKKKKRPGLDT